MDVHLLFLGTIWAAGAVIGAGAHALFSRRRAGATDNPQRMRYEQVLLKGAVIAFERRAKEGERAARVWRQAFLGLLQIVDPAAAERAMREVARVEAGAAIQRAAVRAGADVGGSAP